MIFHLSANKEMGGPSFSVAVIAVIIPPMQRIFTFSVLLALAATMVIAADPPLMDGVSGRR